MPPPIAHYSPHLGAGGWEFVSGQLGIKDGTLLDGVEAQARQALENLTAQLLDAGLLLTDVVKCTVFMTDIANFSTINAIYADVFGDHRPARSAIAVAGLPLGGLVEIEAVAYRGTAEPAATA